MANDGVVVVGDSLQGYTERNIYVSWDINPDLRNERKAGIEIPYYRFHNFRYATHEHIDHIYTTRWSEVVRAYQPITERSVIFNYKQLVTTSRHVYVYQDTRERVGYTEGLFTQTPLLLKYPKYYNWSYIPQVINPEFKVWSYYDIDEDNITIKVISSNGKRVILNSGVNKDKFSIQKLTEHTWKITVYIDEVFEPDEKVSVYVTMYDIKGNELKPGFW